VVQVRLEARRWKIAALTTVVVLLSLMAGGSAQAALRAPAPESPAASAMVEAAPTFSWRAVRRAAVYEFQLSDDQKFNSLVLGTGRGGSLRTKNTAATLEKTLQDGNYFWRVRAITAKERVGAWSKPRSLTKLWKTAPVLQSPSDDFAVAWPSLPLMLRWSAVPHATRYLVTIATDPSLAQIVSATANKAVDVPGTAFALQGTLPAGRYYWAITPVDAGGFRGTRSRVGSFTWSWPTATAPTIQDLNDTDQVFDPLLSWDLVPGAARYEVEINPDDDFAAGSRVCCKDPIIGTSLSPVRLLPNNNDLSGASGYNWRVRAFDVDGNPGQWNRGPTFQKAYDQTTPAVPNVAVETVTSADSASASPLVTWGAVPGAAQYQVQWTVFSGGFCGWTNASVPVKTSSLAWAPLSPTLPTGVPGGPYPGITTRSGEPFANGVTYCVRIRALSDDSFRENDSVTSPVIGPWTQAGGGGENDPAFTYGGVPTTPDPAPTQLPPATYLTPIASAVTRTPILRWTPVAGARRYFVIIARDSNFTNVVDAAFTAMPAYIPNLVLEDETTAYFWAVVPASQSNGSGISGGPKSYNPQTFNKLSIPPAPMNPVGGVDVSTQPTFRWTPAEGAQKYRVQVSADPQFGDLLDNVVTSSTAYTSSTPYPVDTVLYWRVRAEQLQVSGTGRVELRWSDVGSFRRSLPSPLLATDIPLTGELPPALTWTPIPGAISYDVHIDQANGTPSDFNLKSPAGTFTKFFGIGTFKYRVRANFAAGSGAVASAYSAPRDFTRVISPPSAPRVTRSKTRLVFSWNPAAAGKSYRVDVSATESFSSTVESVTTNNTSWAPKLTSPAFRGTGPLYWRVATVDEGSNTGAFVSAAIRKGKALSVRVRGSLRRNSSSRLTIIVRGSGKALRGASIRVSGAGVKTTTRRTGKSGKASIRLRPTKRGSVTVVVKRSGYADKIVTVRVA
jgi:hypothetical protein